MNAEERIQEVHQAEVRALRALRMALTAVHDSWQDVITICGLEPNDRDPEQSARTMAWNLFGPLLLEASKSLEALCKNPSLGERAITDVIEECDKLIQLKRKEIIDGV